MLFAHVLSLGCILCLALAGCGDYQSSGVRISGNLYVNGPGTDGGVLVDNKRVYSLRGIVAGNNYTVRTQIASNSTATMTGTLSGDIYVSREDYLSSTPTFSLVSRPSGSYNITYEKYFHADLSGDYFIELSGTPNTAIDTQSFYDLRLLSSSVTTSFSTAPTTTIIAANAATILAGYVHLYSGTTVSPPGTYTLSLTTASTTTVGNPRMFIYADPSLSVDSLLYSTYTTSTDYMITNFGLTTTTPSPANEIPGLEFSGTGPYILVEGNTSIAYTLTVR